MLLLTMTGAPTYPLPAGGQHAADEAWLRETLDLAVANVADGGGPFAAVVVRNGTALAYGENRVTRDLDPTAHAEVVALRRACAAVGDFSLPGATLYSSCEPCPLCAGAALWARVSRVVYAADRDDAARAGFDDRDLDALFARDRATWPVAVEQVRLDGRWAPFDRWLAEPGRVPY